MKIKDIAIFRTSWKIKEGFREFDEHFIGAKYEDPEGDINGFYRIVNGIVYDIKGDLTPKLQNAQDEQAIYEFIQNAADSNSTNCAVIYDKSYFMIINNGNPFTVKDVAAILNSFQGTKADKSQIQNCDKIGRYGIGFKLVHRLVGENDGVNELIEKLEGPVVFSWFSNDQFTEFVGLENDAEFTHDTDLESNSTPWLFKIALTCFPTMPEEKVKGLDYKDTVIYKKDEFISLKSFVVKHIEKINSLNLSRGSLFFLKFGKNKFQNLEKSINNINSGIGYSLNALKTLDTVIIQDEIVKKIPIEKIKIKIEPDTEEFKLIESEFPECPIEILFGYKPNDFETLRNAPNIYQFFPMRNESHGLSFIIHASSFAKVTDRTKLDDQGKSNSATFQILSYKIQKFLQEEYQITNKGKARDIFKAIVFSEISGRENSQLIVNEFLKPMINYFRHNVPTITEKFIQNTSVLLKGTTLNIHPSDFGISKEWFFWDIHQEKPLTVEAAKPEKIGLKEWDLADLLNHAYINKVNQWIRDTDENERLIFLDEMNRRKEINNLSSIQFLKCSDGNFYSLDQIRQRKNIIVRFDKIANVAEILNKLNLITTDIDISKYEVLREKASNSLSYLKEIHEHSLFENYIRPSESVSILDSSEKKRLFLSVKALHGIGMEKLRQWIIFKNHNGVIKPTGELISHTVQITDSWLSRYQIHTTEYFPELDELLVKREDIYSSIIFPKWSEIIRSNTFTEQAIERFYNSIKEYYYPDNHSGNNLGAEKYIFSGSEFLGNSQVFFHKEFISFSNYSGLASAIKKATDYETPSQKILRFLTEPPFETRDGILLDHLQNANLEISEANELLRFCKKTEVKIFTKAIFSVNENTISLRLNSPKRQYYSDDKNLIEFVNRYLSEDFELLPGSLSNYKNLDGLLRNQDLYTNINSLINNKPTVALDVFRLLNHQDLIVGYLRGLDEIHLDAKAEMDQDSFEYLAISNIIKYFEESEYIHLKEKIKIKSADNFVFKLTEVNDSNDITFHIDKKKYPLKISEILPEADNFSKSDILDAFISKFDDVGLSVTKLFRMDTEAEDLIDNIANNLLESIQNQILKNAAQVAFALLYKSRNADWADFNKLKIHSLKEGVCPLDGVWYVREYSFLNEYAITSNIYHGLDKKLNLNKRKPFFKIGPDCHIALKPAFEESDYFFCAYIDKNLNSEKCQSFFDFLFKEYAYQKLQFKRADWRKLGDSDIGKVIGFSPRLTILTEETEFVLDSEQAPDWLVQWADTAEKVDFVGIFGTHLSSSEIIRLRKSFKDEPDITEDALVSSDSLNDTLLEQTLEWLGEKSIVVADDERLALFKAILSKLKWSQDEGRSIDREVLSLQSNEWDDADYKIWRTEPNSFEVRELLGPIPYKYEYSEGIKIAEERDGDYWFDENEKIFYSNKQRNTLLQLQLAAQHGIIDSEQIIALTNHAIQKIEKLNQRVKELEELIGAEPELPARKKFLSEWIEKSREQRDFKWLIGALEWEYEQSKYSLTKKHKLVFKSLSKFESNRLFMGEVDADDEMPTNLSYLKELSNNKIFIEITTPKKTKQQIENFVILESTDSSLLIEVLDPTFPVIHSLSTAALILPKDNLLLRGLLEFWKNTGFQDSVSLTLIEWLRDKFKPSHLEFLFGPPGTGKTTKLAQSIVSHLVDAKRIIVLTPTNKSADVLFSRIHQELVKATDRFALIQRFDRNDKRNILDEGDAVVVVSTIHRFVMDSFSDDTRLRDILWDLCAIDEASMIALPYFFVPLVAASQAKFIVAGDPFQLLPIGETPSLGDQIKFEKKGISPLSGFATENIYTLLKIDRFEPGTTELDHSIRLLTHNYRSLPSIVHLFSRFRYRDSKDSEILTCESISDTRQIRLKGNLLPIILQVDFPVQLPLNPNEPQLTDILRYDYAAYHIQSAILSISLAKQLLDENPGITLSILSPYTLQVKLCEALLKPDRKKYGNRLFVSSVHRAQGEETDVAIFLLNPASNNKSKDGKLIAGNISHFNNPNLLNVAISRPKCQLIILKPTDVFVRSKNAGYTLMDEVFKDTTSLDMETWDAKTLEQKLFGDTYDIQQSTYIQRIKSFDVFSMQEIEQAAIDRIFLVGEKNVQLILSRS